MAARPNELVKEFLKSEFETTWLKPSDPLQTKSALLVGYSESRL